MSGEETPPGWEDVLEPGERVIWQGRPDPDIRWQPPEGRDLRGGIAMSGFGIIWCVAVAVNGSIAWVFGLLFVGLGISKLAGQHYWKARQLRRTTYTLTTNRAIIATESGGRRGMTSYPIDATTPVASDGVEPATITFATQYANGASRQIGFQRVRPGREIMEMFRAVQRGQA